MAETRISRRIKAPRQVVYRALVEANLVKQWKAPDNMSIEIHEFDAREGGSFRVSLTYLASDEKGKTSAHTDTYHGHFAKLVPGERVVEVLEFETSDPSMAGKMRITTTLTDADGGTELTAVHEGLPPGLSAADNELGWRNSLDRLATLVERARPPL